MGFNILHNYIHAIVKPKLFGDSRFSVLALKRETRLEKKWEWKKKRKEVNESLATNVAHNNNANNKKRIDKVDKENYSCDANNKKCIQKNYDQSKCHCHCKFRLATPADPKQKLVVLHFYCSNNTSECAFESINHKRISIMRFLRFFFILLCLNKLGRRNKWCCDES